MDMKKYGVSLSLLKSLQQFQLSLKERKRKRFEMPFQAQCLVSINDDEEPQVEGITANPGSLALDGWGVVFLKGRVKSVTESDVEVTIEGKKCLFKKMVIRFKNEDEKTRFIISLGNLFESSADEFDDTDDDSGL